MNQGRREFLLRCGQGAAAALPLNFLAHAARFGQSLDPSGVPGTYHLHPHYKLQRPLDVLLAKTAAGSDEFITEKYQDQIAAILEEWSAALRSSATDRYRPGTSFAPEFSGQSLKPADSKLLRGGSDLQVWKMEFRRADPLGKESFLEELRSALSPLTEVITADFQVTAIDAEPSVPPSAIPRRVKTQVRFEVVGSGAGFYREQRVGVWKMEWAGSSGAFLIQGWRPVEEVRSRSSRPFYADISALALGHNRSYSEQMLHGVDYWRTVLDGACGIDIYGHNGISVGDVDGDGFDDLYVCQPAGLPNRLYRNRGDGTFDDITESSGVGLLDNTACALFADIDNDGRQDLIVVRASGPLLFVNQGEGKFHRTENAFQFAQPPQGTFTGAAIADYDRDGWLDLYFCLYAYYQGADQYRYPVPYYAAENGPPNFLLRNQRDGTFRDVTKESGLSHNNTRYSFCCGWGDYNGDGWPDLYVVNDFGRKNLYRNNGNGTFTDVALQAGVEDIGAGMSVCWLDYDNDGVQDLYVCNMWTAAGERISTQEVFKKDSPPEVRAQYRKHAGGNSLFGDEGGDAESFKNKTDLAGVGMGRWSWSSDAWDFDHDGFLDLYVANGMISGPSREDLNSFFWRQVVARSPDDAAAAHKYEEGWNAINELIRADGTWSGFERNVFYANNRDGTFSDVSGAVGLDFLEDGRSFAISDFDGDGRQEIFLKNRNSPQLRILRNVMTELPPSIAFRLRGTKSNRDAIGATVTIETSAGKQVRMLQAGSGFLSQHSKQLFIGLGEAKGPVRASIRWPSGLVQQLEDLPANHIIHVEEGHSPSRTEPFQPATKTLASSTQAQTGRVGSEEMSKDKLPEIFETWLLSPLAAPDFSLPDSTGRTWSLSAARGESLLLYFSSTNAGSWQEQLHSLAKHQRSWASQHLQLCAVCLDSDRAAIESWSRNRPGSFPLLPGTEEVAAIYSIFYRYLFGRHRDMTLPCSFLIDAEGNVLKLYQGPIDCEQVGRDLLQIQVSPAQRLARALPFPGVSNNFEFGRNYLSYGSAFFQRGYSDQAGAFFQQALLNDPSSAEALYGLGSVYLNQKQTEKARASFESATKLQPAYPNTLPNTWNNLGLLATREHKIDEAIAFFRKALDLDPQLFVALENLGNAYRQQKRWEDARTTLEKALALNAKDAEANYSLAMVFAQTDESDSAYAYLRKALELRPDYPEALSNLGVLYLRTRRRDEAVASFEACIHIAPDFEQAYLNLAQVYALEDQPAKAREILLQLTKRRPDDVPAQKALEQLPK